MNPWPIIGGVATSVCTEEEFINPIHLEVGDVIVLTKPLGTQPAVNAHQWMSLDNQFWKQIQNIITPEEGMSRILLLYVTLLYLIMLQLNMLMKKLCTLWLD